MSYLIDAWLERPDPYLRITHRHTGISVIEWRDDRVRALLDRGVICPSDLQHCSCCSKELVQELFLLACLEGERCHCAGESGRLGQATQEWTQHHRLRDGKLPPETNRSVMRSI